MLAQNVLKQEEVVPEVVQLEPVQISRHNSIYDDTMSQLDMSQMVQSQTGLLSRGLSRKQLGLSA